MSIKFNKRDNAQLNSDLRGNLGVFNLRQLPFIPKRFFWIFRTPAGVARAGHAHMICEQFLLSLNGEVKVRIVEPNLTEYFETLKEAEGLYLPKRTWLEITQFSEGAVLGVWASHEYDRSEYIEIFEDFKKLVDL
jgi:UDP-2-acetamido-3-amino-2,3-dideoxy-glucuronate N-acetyltransferase